MIHLSASDLDLSQQDAFVGTLNSLLQQILRRAPDSTVLPLFVNTTNLQVGVGTITPNASAVLDLVSTTKGFGFPSMTSAQRLNIASPRAGLAVFDSDISQWMGYNGTNWVILG